MTLTREEVEYIAELAHLALDEDEIALYQEQLAAILDYAERLQAVDTEAIPPTASVLPLHTVLRDDVIMPSLTIEQTWCSASLTSEVCFHVPPLR